MCTNLLDDELKTKIETTNDQYTEFLLRRSPKLEDKGVDI